MNGGNRLENLIRGGQPIEQVTTEENNEVNAPAVQEQKTQSVQTLVTQKRGAEAKEGHVSSILVGSLVFILILAAVTIVAVRALKKKRQAKEFERALKLVPMLIHLPPSTDDIQGGGRDERDVNDEAISQATIMYTIISSTIKKSGMKTHIYGQKYFSFEIVAVDGFVKYYAVVPAVLTETVKQAILTSYPTARLEETEVENIFSRDGMDTSEEGTNVQYNAENFVSGGELVMKKDVEYPIMTFQEMKWDAQLALLNAFSKVRKEEGLGLQVMFRPLDSSWSKIGEAKIKNIKSGKKSFGSKGSNLSMRVLYLMTDIIRAPFEVPDEHKKDKDEP